MDERREWTERKNKKGKMVFLTILLLIVLAGGGFLAKKHYDLRKDYNYLEQNKDSIVDEEVNQRLEQVQMAEREIVHSCAASIRIVIWYTRFHPNICSSRYWMYRWQIIPMVNL